MLYDDAVQATSDSSDIGVLDELTFVHSSHMPDISLIPQQIRTIITNLGHYQKKYTLSMQHHTYTISLWYPTESNKSTEQKTIGSYFNRAIQQIYTWLHMVDPYAKTNCSQKVDIYIWFTNHHKKLPAKKGEIIGELNVNTAFTTSCNRDTSKIYIYRKEEWFKVLIHETFHNLGLDFSSFDSPHTLPKMFNVVPSPSKGIRIYESYCETWGEIIFLFLSAYWSTKTKIECKRVANQLLHAQIRFSAFQVSKILHHYDITYDELVDKTSHKHFKEDTPVLSYYIVKFIFLYHSVSFLDWCRQNNYPKQGNIIRFRQSASNIKRYISLLSSLYKDKNLVQFIRLCESNYSKYSPTDTTMRMVFEL